MQKKNLLYIWSVIVVLASTLMFLYTPIGGKLYSGTSTNGGFISDINFNDKSFHTTKRLQSSSTFSSQVYVRQVSQQQVYASNRHDFNAENFNNTIANNGTTYQAESHNSLNTSAKNDGRASSGIGGAGLKSLTAKPDVNRTASSNSSFVLLTNETQRSSVTTSNSSLNLADNGADPQKATLDEPVPVSDGIFPLFILLISYSTFLFFRNKK